MKNWRNKTWTRPAELSPDDAMAVKVVAVIGHAKDFAVYEGPSDWTDEKVAAEGTMILEPGARAIFPVCRLLRYRD
jgi:hypothetical protein